MYSKPCRNDKSCLSLGPRQKQVSFSQGPQNKSFTTSQIFVLNFKHITEIYYLIWNFTFSWENKSIMTPLWCTLKYIFKVQRVYRKRGIVLCNQLNWNAGWLWLKFFIMINFILLWFLKHLGVKFCIFFIYLDFFQ